MCTMVKRLSYDTFGQFTVNLKLRPNLKSKNIWRIRIEPLLCFITVCLIICVSL